MITIPSARGVLTRSPFSEEAVITTIKSSGTFRMFVAATAPESGSYNYSTIRITVLWWDGTKTTQSYDAGYEPELGGGSLSLIPFSFSKSISSPYNNTNPKVLRAFISDANGRALGYRKNMYIDTLYVYDNVTGQDNGVSNIDISGLSRLNAIDCSINSNLTTLTRLPKTLTSISAAFCNLSSIDLSGINLQYLYIHENPNLSSLNVSGCTALTILNCYNTGISTLTLNGLSVLTQVIAHGCPSLTSVRAVGVGSGMGTYYTSGFVTYSYFYSGINVASCNLSGAALNQLYTDLDTVGFGTAYLLVQSQAGGGEGSDNPTIATNKGYTVLGT